MQESAGSTLDQPHLDGPRAARVEEQAALIDMVNFVFRISQGRPPTIRTDWPHVYAVENLANVQVVCDPQRVADPATVGGTIVASTGVWASDVVIGDVRLRVGGINCVGTLPEYRRLGLGSTVMAAAQQTMRDLGCHVGLLSTGITNWYRRMGWENAAVVRTYRVNRGNRALLPSLPAGVQARIVPVGTEAVADTLIDHLLRLRAEARLGATRTAASLRQLLTARRISHVVLAVGADGKDSTVAYALVNEQRVVEWAGETALVLGLVRALFDDLDDHSLSTSQRASDGSPVSLRTLFLLTPAPTATWQPPLVAWLDAHGFPFGGEYLGMLYLIDPPRVLEAYGVDDVTVSAAGENFTLHVGGETHTLNRGQLTKLFFGPERLLPSAAQFPLPFWQWYLELV